MLNNASMVLMEMEEDSGPLADAHEESHQYAGKRKSDGEIQCFYAVEH